ncbi:MAG: hypothetical protein ACK478_02535 [Flavobacteriales bacterium]
MKSFLFRLLVFSLPMVAIGIVYIGEDPFKVLRSYTNYHPVGIALSVPLNQSMVSTSVFDHNHHNAEYNAFIFGSSRSMFYQENDWKKHLPVNAHVFHFDASSETIEGIAHKLKYTAESGSAVDYALIIIDGNSFDSQQSFNEHLYMEDPKLQYYRNVIAFQSAHWMAFLDRSFLRAYGDYRLTQEAKPYMWEQGVLDHRPFVYDSISNELRYDYFENLIDSGKYYTEERMKTFYPRSGKIKIAAPVIADRDEAVLVGIAHQLQQLKTDFYVVISPLYNQISMNPGDVEILQSIFGKQRVYDFSGVNRFTEDYTHYYERSHYRPFVAARVMDSIYGR